MAPMVMSFAWCGCRTRTTDRAPETRAVSTRDTERVFTRWVSAPQHARLSLAGCEQAGQAGEHSDKPAEPGAGGDAGGLGRWAAKGDARGGFCNGDTACCPATCSSSVQSALDGLAQVVHVPLPEAQQLQHSAALLLANSGQPRFSERQGRSCPLGVPAEAQPRSMSPGSAHGWRTRRGFFHQHSVSQEPSGAGARALDLRSTSVQTTLCLCCKWFTVLRALMFGVYFCKHTTKAEREDICRSVEGGIPS